VSAWCLGVLNAHRRFFLSYVAPVLWNLGILAGLFTLGPTAGGRSRRSRPAWGWCSAGPRRSPCSSRRSAACCGARCGSRSTATVPGCGRCCAPSGRSCSAAGWCSSPRWWSWRSRLAAGGRRRRGPRLRADVLPAADRPVRHERGGGRAAGAVHPGRARPGRTDRTARRGPGPQRLLRGSADGRLPARRRRTSSTVLFGRGAFDAETTFQVAVVLGVYSLGLRAGHRLRLLQSVLYAVDDTRTPAVSRSIRVAVALTVAVPLMFNLDRIVVDLSEPAGFVLAEGAGCRRWPRRRGAAGGTRTSCGSAPWGSRSATRSAPGSSTCCSSGRSEADRVAAAPGRRDRRPAAVVVATLAVLVPGGGLAAARGRGRAATAAGRRRWDGCGLPAGRLAAAGPGGRALVRCVGRAS
jgi:hypothetical protein